MGVWECSNNGWDNKNRKNRKYVFCLGEYAQKMLLFRIITMHRNMKACFHMLGKCIAGVSYRTLCTTTRLVKQVTL